MTEDLMIAGCLNNNALAQEALYNYYSPRMLGVCYRFSKNKEDAEDILQDAFIKVFEQLKNYRNEGPLEAWIRRIIVHTSINSLKKNKKFNDSIDLVHANNLPIEENLIHNLMHAKQVVECIRLLPIGFRTVLNLFAIEGYSHREIAQLLEIEESTSRSQYLRAKVVLSNILIKKKIILLPNNSEIKYVSNYK